MSVAEGPADPVEAAHLAYLRGDLETAARALRAVLVAEPANGDAARLLATVERDLRERAVRRAARRRSFQAVMGLLGAACLLAAFMAYTWTFGTKYHPAMAGPVVHGLRRGYWHLLLTVGLGLAGLVCLGLAGWFDPDWRDLERSSRRFGRGDEPPYV